MSPACKVREMKILIFSVSVVLTVIAALSTTVSTAEIAGIRRQDYAEALWKCIMFFDGQRSGKLPSSQRMTWRKDSALDDGKYLGVPFL